MNTNNKLKNIKLSQITKKRLDNILWKSRKYKTYDDLLTYILDNVEFNLPCGSYPKLLRLYFIKHWWVICEHCDKRRAKEIHHKDRNHNNNNLTNLGLVCHSCHLFIHGKLQKYLQKDGDWHYIRFR